MDSIHRADGAMTSWHMDRPDRERCPGNLCVHVSSPAFRGDEKEDLDSLLHNSCNNCASQAEQEPLCNFCRHLRLRHLGICLRDKLTGLDIELDLDRNTRGSGMSRIMSNKGCTLCSFLATVIRSYFAMSKNHGEDEDDEENIPANTRLSLSLNQEYGRRLILKLYTSDNNGEIEITYHQPSEGSTPTVGGRVSWPTVRQWIRLCTHDHDCTRSELPKMPQGFRLIDIEGQKLVSDFPSGSKLGVDVRFVALSYVWGKPLESRNSALLSSNEHELEAPDGLGKIGVPKAIKDAITICRQLDQRFLWVDRFCIQQDDDGPEKQAQINAMGDIYSSAEFTIIHASGTSMEDPIAGVTTARKTLQSKVVICGFEMVSGYPDIKAALQSSKWIERGWTYQEAALSRRKLFFTPFELWFECSDSYAPYQREEQCSKRRQGPFVSDADKFTMAQYRMNGFAKSTTIFQDFVRHLEWYTPRSLTYQSDTLHAFMGILTTLYKGDLGIYGLPEVDFDQALLWYCKTKQMAKLDTHSFPSWSWASAGAPVTAPSIWLDQKGFLGPLTQWSYKGHNGVLKTVKSTNSLHPRAGSDTSAQAHLLVAWWKGCIEAAVPEDVKREFEKCSPTCGSSEQVQRSFIERVWGHIEKAESCATCKSQIAQRWPCLEEVWKDIQKARNSGLWETPYPAIGSLEEERLLIEKLRPGVLLTRAQTARLKVSFTLRWHPRGLLRTEIYLANPGGRRIGIIRPEYVDMTLRKALDTKPEAPQTDFFECMGISLSDDQKLGSNQSTSLDSQFDLKFLRSMAEVITDESRIQEVTRGVLPDDQFGIRYPAINVLVIHHEEGSPFARRMGVGWVYLADWIKADRAFKTIMLE